VKAITPITYSTTYLSNWLVTLATMPERPSGTANERCSRSATGHGVALVSR